MKPTILFLFIVLFSFELRAQNPLILPKASHGTRTFPDSVRVEFSDQHGLIIFQLLNFGSDTGQLKKDMLLIRQVVENVERSSTTTTSAQQVEATITRKGERKIIIHQAPEAITKIMSTEKEITELLPTGWEFRIRLEGKAEIYAYAQTFTELKSIIAFSTDELTSLLVSTREQLYFGRKRIVGRVIIQNDKMVFNSIKFETPQDQISLYVSAGLGFLNSHFYPELNANLSLRFNDRFNTTRRRFTLIYNNLFFSTRTADGKYNNRTNSFISIASSRKFGGEDSHTWATIGAGYLVMRKGDYFTGKTAKFFFSSTVGAFTITPEFYLTNDFKTFQQGLKIGYTF